MLGLGMVDWAVLVVYLIGITSLGIWMARRVHDMSNFFMPRRFGKAMMIMHTFGTGTHSDHAVGVTSKTFTNGLSGTGTSGCGSLHRLSTGSSRQ